MPKIYFQDILRSAIFPLLLLLVIFLNLSFDWVFYALLASFIISCVALVVYSIKHLPFSVKFAPKMIADPVSKELILFSLPLLGMVMLDLIVAWTDTLMLGYFKVSADVGLYNAAITLARFLSFPLQALTLIYVPVISEFTLKT